MAHDVWVEVDLAALRHNLGQVRALVGDDVKIMAVVKANGYGHGYVEPARAFVEAGADALAVTRMDEALAIRNAGVSVPILLFAPVPPEDAAKTIEADLDFTVTSADHLGILSQAAASLGKVARVHVKVDTGMHRLGVSTAKAEGLIKEASAAKAVSLEGVYTHFACASERDLASAQAQRRRFARLLQDLASEGVDYGLAHAANSAAIIRMPDSHFDMVRPGTILYGQYPSAHVPRVLDLKPTWKLKARICQVKELARGADVGYGGEFTAPRPLRAAVIPIGWADGFTLVPEGPIYRQSTLRFFVKMITRKPHVVVRGHKAPVLGRVAMQMIVVDVTDVPDVQFGDEVDVPALRIPTSPLIPRVYTGEE